MMRRRGWIIGLLLIGFTCAAIIVSYQMTPLFRSEGRILVEEGDIPSDLVSTTVRGFVEERIELVRQRVFTNEHLNAIIEEHDLYSDDEVEAAGTSAANMFRRGAAVVVEELADGTISFIVAFDHKEPRKARDTVNSLMRLFLAENVASRTESASEAAAFLETEAARLAGQIAEFEVRIARYKEENRGGLPEQQNLNMQMLDRAERELNDVGAEIRTLEQRRTVVDSDILRHQNSVSNFTGDVPAPGSADRLKYLQAEYLRMMSVYSPEHPDLVRVRKEIELLSPGASGFNKTFIQEQIRIKQGELSDARMRYSDDHPDVISLQRQLADLREDYANAPEALTVDSATQDPELVRLTAERDGIDKELAAQRTRQRQLRSSISELQGKLASTPQVELELLELTRGYDQLREKYDDIKLKQTQVELAVSAEQAQRAGRFGIVTSPLVATTPAVPNRPAVIFLGFLLGLGLGFATAASLESADKTIRDQHDVREIWGAPPLVAIPEIRNQADTRRRMIQTAVYSASIVAMVAGAVFSVIQAPV